MAIIFSSAFIEYFLHFNCKGISHISFKLVLIKIRYPTIKVDLFWHFCLHNYDKCNNEQ